LVYFSDRVLHFFPGWALDTEASRVAGITDMNHHA
jgi:hypothetical protein